MDRVCKIFSIHRLYTVLILKYNRKMEIIYKK